jgi:methylthioribulose-1-phosphate dehydratase
VRLRDLEMLKALDQPPHDEVARVPVIGNSQDMAELSARFDADREPVPAVLVAGHGSYVWGADVRQARHRTEALDWLLGLALRLA